MKTEKIEQLIKAHVNQDEKIWVLYTFMDLHKQILSISDIISRQAKSIAEDMAYLSNKCHDFNKKIATGEHEYCPTNSMGELQGQGQSLDCLAAKLSMLVAMYGRMETAVRKLITVQEEE